MKRILFYILIAAMSPAVAGCRAHRQSASVHTASVSDSLHRSESLSLTDSVSAVFSADTVEIIHLDTCGSVRLVRASGVRLLRRSSVSVAAAAAVDSVHTDTDVRLRHTAQSVPQPSPLRTAFVSILAVSVIILILKIVRKWKI